MNVLWFDFCVLVIITFFSVGFCNEHLFRWIYLKEFIVIKIENNFIDLNHKIWFGMRNYFEKSTVFNWTRASTWFLAFWILKLHQQIWQLQRKFEEKFPLWSQWNVRNKTWFAPGILEHLSIRHHSQKKCFLLFWENFHIFGRLFGISDEFVISLDNFLISEFQTSFCYRWIIGIDLRCLNSLPISSFIHRIVFSNLRMKWTDRNSERDTDRERDRERHCDKNKIYDWI